MMGLRLLLHLSATSPYWSELAAACSRWCRGRGICWFVRRLDGLEFPVPAQWTPAWREAAQHQDRQHQQLTQTPLHPARPLAPSRIHAGRIPGGYNVEVVTFTHPPAFSKHMYSTNTLVSWISISSVCWRPLPPAHLQEFWGREEVVEREGDPRTPAGTDRDLLRQEDRNGHQKSCNGGLNFQKKNKSKLCYLWYLCACWACIDMGLLPRSLPP